MGDSRSWAAEMENETVTCPHGQEHGYFNRCRCAGCREDQEVAYRIGVVEDRVVRMFTRWRVGRTEQEITMKAKVIANLLDQEL